MRNSSVSKTNWKRRVLAVMLALSMTTQQGVITFAGEADPAAVAAASQDDSAAKAEAEAKAKAEAEAKAKAEAEAAAKAQAEAEAAEKARQEAEAAEKARQESEAAAKAQAEAEAAEKARQESEAAEKARLESEAAAKAESERIAQEQADAQAKAEEEAAQKAESERQEKEESEKAAQTEAGTSETTETAAETTKPSENGNTTAEEQGQKEASETTPQADEQAETPAQSDLEGVVDDAHDADEEKEPESEEFETEFTFSDSSVTVKAVTTKGAGFPKGTKLHADYLAPGTPAYESALASVEKELGISAEDSRKLYGVIYDIYFDVKGKRVEPDDTVHITMSFAHPVVTDIPEDAKIVDTVVMHVNDDGTADNVKEYVNSAEDGSISKVGFKSDDFSPVLVGAVAEEGNKIPEDENGENQQEQDNEPILSAQEDIDLNSFVTEASILLNGVEVTPDENGKITVNTGQTYTAHVRFEEVRGGRQFVNDGSVMYYRIPDGFVVGNPNGTFVMDLGNDGTVSGNKYEYDPETKQIKVTWNTTDDNFRSLTGVENAFFYIDMEGKFSGESTSINYGNGVTKTIEPDSSHNVSVNKTGYFDNSENKMKYTITVNSEGTNSDVNVSDVISGTALTLDQDSIVIKKNDIIYAGEYTINKTDKGFQISFPQLVGSDKITIDYDALIDYTKIGKSGNATKSETGNKVTITNPDDGNPNDNEKEHFENNIYYSSFTKTADTVGSVFEKEDGEKYRTVNWTIKTNDARKTSIAGSTITDTISADSASRMSYSGTGITITVTTSENTTETRNVFWNELTAYSNSSWTYTIPNDDGNYSYEITYTTDVKITGLMDDVNVSNSAEGKGGSGNAGMPVGPDEDEKFTASKSVVSYNQNEIVWNIDVNVPAKGYDTFTIKDNYPVQSSNASMKDSLKKQDASVSAEDITVTGLLDGESYTVSEDTNSGSASYLIITFYQDEDHNTTGLRSSSSKRTISVSLTTNNNQEWLDFASQNAWAASHTNNAEVTANGTTKPVSASASPVKQNITKEKYNDIFGKTLTRDGEEYIVYGFRVILEGATESVTITDTFPSPFALYDYRGSDVSDVIWALQNYSNCIEGGDDVWNYNATAKENVSVQATDTGASFSILGSDLPKKSNGTNYGYYRLTYYLIAKTSDLAGAAVNASGVATFQNKVEWGSIEDSVDWSYEYKGVKKELTNVDDSTRTASYRITINPTKSKLNNGDNMILTDTFTNLSVDYSSIHITTDPADKNVVYDYSGNVGTFSIPDLTKVIIEYDAKIVGNGRITFSNIAEMKAYSDSRTDTRTYNSSAAGGGGNIGLRLFKYQKGDMNIGLNGAVFQLYDENKNPIKNGESDITFSTSNNGTNNGYVSIKLNMNDHGTTLAPDKVYYLKEIAAPDGYQLDNTWYSFLISEHSDYTAPSGIYVYHDNDIIKVSNEQIKGKLTIKKTVNGINLSAEQKARISFNISGTDNPYSLTVPYTDFEADGTYTIEDLDAGTYTVTETSADLNGYIRTTKYTVKTGSSTGEETTGDSASVIVTQDAITNKINHEVDFTNTYTKLTTSLSLEGTKALDDTAASTPFTFSLSKTGSNADHIILNGLDVGTARIETSNNASGEFSFNNITFDAPGTYSLLLKEEKGTDPSINYDPTEYNLEVVVSEVKDANDKVTGYQVSSVKYAGSEITPNDAAGNVYTVPNLTSGLRTFNNTKKTGTLSIKKIATKDQDAYSGVFNFKLTKIGANGSADTSFGSDGIYTFTVESNKGAKTISNLPLGKYKIEETGNPDVTSYSLITTVTGVDENNIFEFTPDHLTQNVDFTNTYTKAESVAISLTGRKFLDGSVSRKKFSFKIEDLTDYNDNNNHAELPAQNIQNAENGVFTFDGITFPAVHTYTLKVSEIEGTDTTINYDLTNYTIQVEVSQDNSNLKIDSVKVINSSGTDTYLSADVSNPSLYPLPGYQSSTSGTFNNTTKTGNLKIKKEVIVSPDNETINMNDFRVQLTDEAGNYYYVDEQGNAIMTDNSSVSIAVSRSSETIVSGLNPGKYKLDEVDLNSVSVSGYTLSTSYVDIDGNLTNEVTIKGGDQKEITLTNTYTRLGEGSIQLHALKTIEGRDLKESDVFTFKLEKVTGVGQNPDDQNNDQTVSNNGRFISFDPLTYTKAGEYKYLISEVMPSGDQESANGITYDTNVFTVTVLVDESPTSDKYVTRIDSITDKDGNQVDLTKGIEFKNRYAASGTSLTLEADKILEGGEIEANQFTFTLMPVRDTTNSIQNKKNDASGHVRFSPLSYDKVGTYTYQIYENTNENDGIIYDHTVYNVTVEVTDDGSGQLKAEKSIQTGSGNTATDIEFTNHVAGPANAVIQGEKQMEGRPLNEGDVYTFTLTPVGSTEGDTILAQNDANGNISFSPMAFDKIGTYTYTLSEDNTGKAEVEKDTVSYTVVIKVTQATGEGQQEDSGNLHAEVEYYKGSSKQEKAVFKNTYHYGSLNITKKVIGNTLSEGEFDFTISLTDAQGDPVNGTFVTSIGTEKSSVTFKDGEGTVSIEGGETIMIEKLPAGARYSIKESTRDGYVLKSINETDVSDATAVSTGTIVEAGSTESETPSTATAVFENQHDTYGGFTLKKKIAGNAAESKSFTFKITLHGDRIRELGIEEGHPKQFGDAEFSLQDGIPTATVSIKGTTDGNLKTVSGLPNGIQYKICELLDPADDGYAVSYTIDGNEVLPVQGMIQNSVVGGTTAEVVATNTRNLYGGFSVTKALITNATTPPVSDYGFKVTLINGKDISGVYGGLTFRNGIAEFTLKAKGNSVDPSDYCKTALKLPNGIRYRIEETDYSRQGYNKPIVIEGVVTGTQTNPVNCADGNIDDSNKVNVTNTLFTAGTLSLTKHLTGNAITQADRNASYEFTIQLSGLDSVKIGEINSSNQSTYGTSSLFSADGSATILVRDGETKYITGIPNRTPYTVTERLTNGSEFTTTFTINDMGQVPTDNSVSGVISDVMENAVVVTNSKDLYGGIILRKATAGNEPDIRSWFAYKVVLDDPEINGTYGDVSFANGVSQAPSGSGDPDYKNGIVPANYVKVTEDRPLLIKGLPNGVGYEVFEADYSGTYDSQESSNSTGTISGVVKENQISNLNENIIQNTVLYTNTRNRYGKLIIEKQISGTPVAANEVFTFDISLIKNALDQAHGFEAGSNGAALFNNGATPTAQVQIPAGGSLTINGLPIGAKFTVKETGEGAKGYSSPSYQLSYQVAVRDAGGNIILDNDGNEVKEPVTEEPVSGEQTGTIESDQRIVVVTNTATSVLVRKTDLADETDRLVPGAELQILEGDDLIREWTSGESDFEITGLKTGVRYTLHEVSAPDGYAVADDTYFQLKADGTLDEANSSAMIREGKLLVQDSKSRVSFAKIDGKGSMIGGAVLKITDLDGKSVSNISGDPIAEWTSSAGKTHVIEGLMNGSYLLVEVKAPGGFIPAEPVAFEIADGKLKSESGEITVSMIDEITKVSVSKVDVTTQEELPGAHIQIIDNTGRVVEEWNSTTTPHEIEGLKIGEEYTLRETVAPNGYTVTTDTSFRLDETGKVTTGGLEKGAKTKESDENHLLVEDAKTSVKISKVDITTEKELPGAKIQIVDKNGKVVEEWTSTNKPHEVTGLTTGEIYTLRETVAPDGYAITTDTTFVLDKNGKVSGGTTTQKDGILLVEDAPVRVSKVDIGTGEELPGAKIQIIDKNGKVVDEWTSTDKPHDVKGVKVGETYTLRETVAPEGYAITTDTTFVLDKNGKVSGGTTTQKDGILLVEDARAPKISKVDIGAGTELPGAHIQVIDSKGNVVDEWDSTTTPHTVKNVKVGETYTLRETVAPEGYAITTDTTFTIDKKGNVTGSTTINKDGILLVEDAKAPQVSKVDATNEKELPGAHIQVIDSKGNVVDEWDSTDKPHTVKNVKVGETYTLRETVAPDGYAITTDTTFVIDKNGKVTGTTKQNSAGVLLVEDQPLSKPQTGNGSIEVTKYTLKNNGAFRVVNETYYTALFSDAAMTKPVSEVKPLVLRNAYTTTVSFTNLPYGTYYVGETDASGTPVSTASNIKKVEIEGGVVTVSQTKQSGSAVIKNTVTEGVLGEYVDVRLKIQKKVVDKSGKAKKAKGTFSFALYSDAACTNRISGTDIVSVKLDNESGGSVSFRNLPYASSFYVAEVDKSGKKVASDKTFGYSVTVSGDGLTYRDLDGKTVTVTNKIKNDKVASENRGKQDENGAQQAVRTGDETPVIPMLLTMLTAGMAALYLVLRRKRRA